MDIDRELDYADYEDAEDQLKSSLLQDGEPCRHPGCLNHVTHPCEGCGRIAGQRVAGREE